MNTYNVYLFRSGRVWVSESKLDAFTGDLPLVTESIEANSEIAALGKLLLVYVDRANQPTNHVCVCEHE